MNKAPPAWLDGGDWFLAALVGLSGALALAWAGLWLVIGSNIRTSMRYRAARRRRPHPLGGTPPCTPLMRFLDARRGSREVKRSETQRDPRATA